jgi:hypothetical protein
LLRLLSKGKTFAKRELVEEIVSRHDAPHLIIELLEPLDRASDGWFSIHSMFMLGIIKSRDAFEALKELVKRVDLEDWIPGDLGYVFANFGKDYLNDLMGIVRNDEYDVWVKIAAYSGMTLLANGDPGVKDKLIDFSERLLRDFKSEDKDEQTLLKVTSMDMASLQHEGLYHKVVALVEEGKIEPEFFFEQDEEKAKKLFLRDLEDVYSDGPEVFEEKRGLWRHFHHENLIYYYKVNYGKVKIGENDPCI